MTTTNTLTRRWLVTCQHRDTGTNVFNGRSYVCCDSDNPWESVESLESELGDRFHAERMIEHPAGFFQQKLTRVCHPCDVCHDLDTTERPGHRCTGCDGSGKIVEQISKVVPFENLLRARCMTCEEVLSEGQTDLRLSECGRCSERNMRMIERREL